MLLQCTEHAGGHFTNRGKRFKVNRKKMSALANQCYTHPYKHSFSHMNTCASSSALPRFTRLSRGEKKNKKPIPTDQKEKQTFWIKVLWSNLGPCVFLVIIIYSRDIDNAPTQTLQGIIHFVCGDVAVPQIVQTTGQSPEPHNSMSKGRVGRR